MILTTTKLERAMLLKKKIIIARLINIIPHICKGFAKINQTKQNPMTYKALS